MARLLDWDEAGKHVFETGVDHCVLYFMKKNADTGAITYEDGVAWSGITAINENPSGADATKMYADNIKYLNIYSAEEFGATIEAYTYPDEWAKCDGSAEMVPGMKLGQQSRAMFGLSYRTKIGNDVDGDSAGYKLHLIYGCQASVSARQYQTVNDSPSAITFSWEMTTTPVNVTTPTGSDYEFKPTSIITIDSTKVNSTKLEDLEAVLYGTAASGDDPAVVAKLPLPDAVYNLLKTTVEEDDDDEDANGGLNGDGQ